MSLTKITLQVNLIFALLGCSYFRPDCSDQASKLSQLLMSQEANTRLSSFSANNKSCIIPAFQAGSLYLIPRIEITGDGTYLLKGVLAVIIAALIGIFLGWVILRIRIKRIQADLDLKDKMLAAIREEQENAQLKIRNMESELIHAREIALQSDKLKNAFVANMSHEIRTPMNAIVGLASLLNDPKLTRAEAEDYIETINSSCKQLLMVIDDIVDISKIESGQLKITLEEVNLNDLLRDLYSLYKDQGKLKNINLIYSAGLSDDHSQIRTDNSRIRQVFRNLLNNAFRFTENGNIEFGYFTDEENIIYYVKDAGIGISPKNQSLIFDRFWQEERSTSPPHGGLGLGLSISKKIVEKMGGTIRIESEPGMGSVFYFSIPY